MAAPAYVSEPFLMRERLQKLARGNNRDTWLKRSKLASFFYINYLLDYIKTDKQRNLSMGNLQQPTKQFNVVSTGKDLKAANGWHGW